MRDVMVKARTTSVDAGLIDLLIHEDYVRSRAAFVRRVITGGLRDRQDQLNDAIRRHGFQVGTVVVDRDLLRSRKVQVIGTALLDADVRAHDVAAIERISVFGRVIASPEVRAALGSRLVTQASARPYTWSDIQD